MVDTMAKKFACADIGLSCRFEARAENEEALMAKIGKHAKSAHNMDRIDPATLSKVKAAIKDA